MKKNILILSGGGCKGAIQLQVLKKFEQDYGPLYEYYDLVCGSSVGAINGAMLASGRITMERLEKIYPEMIKKVFKRRLGIPFYDRKNFYNVWMDEIGSIKLGDCLTKLQITSVNLCDKRNHFFKSWTKDGEQFLVAEVAKSFAAPLYFGTFIDTANKCVWFDGGMGVGNIPVAYGLVEAELLWSNQKWHFDIIGCGYVEQSIPFDEAKKYKVFRQLEQFFDFGDAGLAREQVRQEQIGALDQLSKSSNKISYKYYDAVIPEKIDKLDGVKYLDEYKKIGIETAKKPLQQNP
jgi:hypothetical protein